MTKLECIDAIVIDMDKWSE